MATAKNPIKKVEKRGRKVSQEMEDLRKKLISVISDYSTTKEFTTINFINENNLSKSQAARFFSWAEKNNFVKNIGSLSTGRGRPTILWCYTGKKYK